MLNRSALAAGLAAMVALTALTACGGSEAASVSCTYTPDGSTAAKQVNPPSTQSVSATHATLRTNRGAITITLTPQATPCTVNSLVSLTKQGYFDDTPCPRVTTSGIYVLQCGDPTGTGAGTPGYQFDDELSDAARPKSCDAAAQSCVYPAGTVAMANAGPNTNGSQFFLVYKDSPLSYNYTIFGHMDAASIKLVEAIAAQGSDNSNPAGGGTPKESVTIEKASTN